jgi:hypothetical protein
MDKFEHLEEGGIRNVGQTQSIRSYDGHKSKGGSYFHHVLNTIRETCLIWSFLFIVDLYLSVYVDICGSKNIFQNRHVFKRD